MTEKELKQTLISFLDAALGTASDDRKYFEKEQEHYLPDSIEWNEVSKLIKISTYLQHFFRCWLWELNKRWSEEDD